MLRQFLEFHGRKKGFYAFILLKILSPTLVFCNAEDHLLFLLPLAVRVANIKVA